MNRPDPLEENAEREWDGADEARPVPVQHDNQASGCLDLDPVDSRPITQAALAMRALQHGPNEWRWFFAAILGAATVIVVVHVAWNRAQGIPFAVLALSLCATTTGLAMMWRRGRLGAKNPVAATLSTVALRTLVMMGALLFVAATKWTHLNSFASSLLGCYFLFLVLESVLSVRWYSSLTRVVES
jgi:hypothetical protein